MKDKIISMYVHPQEFKYFYIIFIFILKLHNFKNITLDISNIGNSLKPYFHQLIKYNSDSNQYLELLM